MIRILIIRSLRLIGESLHRDLRLSLATHQPHRIAKCIQLVAREVSHHVLHLHIGIAHAEEELQLGTDAPFITQLM